MRSSSGQDGIGTAMIILVVVFLIFGGVGGCCFFAPQYGVYQQEMEGKAELAKADYSKQVAVQTAKAKQDSAQYEAQAEITRAGGVAKANEIIGKSLQNNEGYLRYLWIDKMGEKEKDVIYVPTEAGLPILEAGKRHEKGDQ